MHIYVCIFEHDPESMRLKAHDLVLNYTPELQVFNLSCILWKCKQINIGSLRKLAAAVWKKLPHSPADIPLFPVLLMAAGFH